MMHALTSLNDGRTNEIVLRITILSFLSRNMAITDLVVAIVCNTRNLIANFAGKPTRQQDIAVCMRC